MNGTLVTALLRQRFTSPVRLLLAFMIGWMPMLPVLVTPVVGFSMLGDGFLLALVVGAGLIGQDVSSGTLPLLLARPVTRPSYVASRWAGATLGTAILIGLQALTAIALISVRGAHVPWRDAALFLGNGILTAAGTSALLVLLSSLMNGLGDLGLLLLLSISGQVIRMAGMLRSWAWLVRAGDELGRFVQPKLNLSPFFGPAPVSWFEVVSYFSTVALCLALAMVVVNRKELSYATSA